MVMIHKFQEHKQTLTNTVAEALGTYLAMPAGKTFGVVNTSDRIILMIDEAHRTQSSDLGDNLFEAFPNATRIAFTGTPLITERHGEKKTHKRFGEYIDTYRLMDAVNDGATLQILYEGKTADSALNEKHAFDEAFEDLFRDRSDEELLAIKKKYGATGDILEAETASMRLRVTWWRTMSTTFCPMVSRHRWCAIRSWRAFAIRTASRPHWPSAWPVRRPRPRRITI